MKLCYVANSRFPSERAHMTQIVQMCNAFRANGHEVTLLVTDRKTHITESPEEFFGVPINFAVIRISVPDVAGRSHYIPTWLHRAAFLFQRIVFALRGARYIRINSFDVVYGRDEWILWFLSKFLKVPMIWESHEAKFSLVAQSLIRKIKKLVVISEGIRDFYELHGLSRERILVAHDAVDNRFLAPHVSQSEAKEVLGVDAEKPAVVYIGGLEHWKGAQILCEAARGQDTYQVYVIGGKEGELPHWRRRYPHVTFLGPRPYRELPEHQQAADVLVIPNTAKTPLSASYTSPLKLFSYMTAKRPIIAARVPSITNVLSNNEAFFFTPDDALSLRETIEHVLVNREESQAKALRAYEKGSWYTWCNRAREVEQFM